MANVNVSVSATGGISCSPDPVQISGSNVTINFNLQTAGYQFAPSNAIVVTNPGSQFPSPSWNSSTGLAAHLVDVNSDNNAYKYTVALVKVSTGQTLSLDPTIENGH